MMSNDQYDEKAHDLMRQYLDGDTADEEGLAEAFAAALREAAEMQDAYKAVSVALMREAAGPPASVPNDDVLERAWVAYRDSAKPSPYQKVGDAVREALAAATQPSDNDIANLVEGFRIDAATWDDIKDAMRKVRDQAYAAGVAEGRGNRCACRFDEA